MNKFVMVFTVGDNTTWSCQVNQPVEYSSKNKLIEAFYKQLTDAVETGQTSFYFLHAVFYVHNFGFWNEKNEYVIYEPEVYTLEEWFKKTKLH